MARSFEEQAANRVLLAIIQVSLVRWTYHPTAPKGAERAYCLIWPPPTLVTNHLVKGYHHDTSSQNARDSQVRV